MSNCVSCGKKSTVRISPDLDVHGFDLCDVCKDEFKQDLILATLDKVFEKRFIKKYKIQQQWK